MKSLLILTFVLMLSIALLLSGCDSIWPGAGGEDLSAVVTIIDAPENWAQDVNWWQTKELRDTNDYQLTILIDPIDSGTVTGGGIHH
ncbi:unnamed protein product, partial [marine sediment metagenome]